MHPAQEAPTQLSAETAGAGHSAPRGKLGIEMYYARKRGLLFMGASGARRREYGGDTWGWRCAAVDHSQEIPSKGASEELDVANE